MKRFTTIRQSSGRIGEELVATLLIKLNFTVIERNYSRRVGEIDIIALKGSQLYFFEVKKSVNESYNPMNNITARKLESMRKTALLYLMSRGLLATAIYSIGVVGVHQKRGLLYIDIIENV